MGEHGGKEEGFEDCGGSGESGGVLHETRRIQPHEVVGESDDFDCNLQFCRHVLHTKVN